jgi:hypothetical protein
MRFGALRTTSSVCNACKVNKILARWNEYFMIHGLKRTILAEPSKLAGKPVLLRDDTDLSVDVPRCVYRFCI